MADDTPNEGFFLSNTALIRILMAVASALVMGFSAMIYRDERATAEALNTHIIDAANKAQLYVRKDDLGEINTRLQRIEDKLDKKADK